MSPITALIVATVGITMVAYGVYTLVVYRGNPNRYPKD